MKKLLGIVTLSLFFISPSYSKIIILSKCSYESDNWKWKPEAYEKDYYIVDTDKNIGGHVNIMTDEALKTSSEPKIHTTKMTLGYYDDGYVVMHNESYTTKYTLDLKKKIVEVYMVDKGKVLTYHKCHSSNIGGNSNSSVIKKMLKILN